MGKRDDTIDIKGLRVAFSEWPAAHGAKTVVMLHGWGAHRGLFDRAAAALHQNGTVRVLTVDFPGFGGSETPRTVWQVDDFVTFLVDVLDALQIPQVDMLVGHSHGGRVSLKSAVSQSERIRKLLLIGSAGVRLPLSFRKRLRVLIFKVCKKLVTLIYWRVTQRERAMQWLREQFGSADYRAAGAMRDTMISVIREDLTPILSQIRQPTLLIWGADDTDTPLRAARILESCIPDAGLVIWEKAGHYAFLDRPDQFDRVSLHFLG
ncbi:MAG: alpha/beta fold hydrolase [Bdellovibrionota bacterium]